jgi:peptidoglycan/xylan/chitin deacetylase (PgdA/CDA1 family)
VRGPARVIGVVASPTHGDAAEEFFELFKTPWERAVPARRYRVVLSDDGCAENIDAEVLLIYSSQEEAVDREAGIGVEHVNGPVDIAWGESTVPIYGRVALFGGCSGASTLRSRGRVVDYRHASGARRVRRIGYDLFQEIHHLLTEGQPVCQAPTPALELHIALLRHLLLESELPFVEIPPRPDGADFTCCLTHDVDFFGIRRHKLDQTLAGFVVRASLGTLRDLVRRRRRVGDAVRNLLALLSLPLVFLGVVPDFWDPFEDYAKVEGRRRSTFFLVPFKGRPGVSPDGTTDVRRAVPYQVSEIRQEIEHVAARGHEIALHGIDAWRDADAGREELRQVTSITDGKSAGVRMHWLYFDRESPRHLEAAGFEYDSTWGYNDAVGYRAGTSQVFRLRESEHLMELPLSIMDTALFFPGRMGLAPDEALQRCRRIVAQARRFGGTVVINWHDRSLAPERLWGRFYQELVNEIEHEGRVWFATAGQAVDWFRWRRSIRLTGERNSNVITIAASVRCPAVPAGVVRTYRPAGVGKARVEERRFDGHEAVELNPES